MDFKLLHQYWEKDALEGAHFWHVFFSLARFVVVCGDGEYIIYTAMALRNKSFGSAQEFIWAHDSSVYAVRETGGTVKIFKNFKEQKSFKPDFGIEGKFQCDSMTAWTDV